MKKQNPLVGDDDGAEDDEPEPYDTPSPEWTPKQQTNWEEHCQSLYENLETEAGRYWFKRTWRPKKRNQGYMERDHVELGTPEDYIVAHVEDQLEPMGDITSVMMRKLGTRNVDEDELEEAISDIVQAKLQQIEETDPDRARRLVSDANMAAELYGASE
jgi:hypothetical protein